MLWALYHGEIAQKYRLQCRDEEAESEESDFEEQAALARFCLLLPRFLYCVATISTLMPGSLACLSAEEESALGCGSTACTRRSLWD